ncbi:NAD(P)-binding protein [Thermoplasma sp.]|uniref:oxidoreductase n=1 Tax=Thermoplasma sp. TaxID=1973142 RepID=UPI00127F34BE|nr:NAD(P)-binding protein [Thermoplasma sp.]KAA8922676.1 MAG: NAD(P)-binding protein [Thermoplasma sp.]
MVSAAEPGYIGSVRIPNRLVMSPMISNMADPDGNTNENHISYLEERAKGGAGLIITEYTYVDRRSGIGSRNQMGMYDERQIPKFSRLTERIHAHGSRVFVQLVHAGAKAIGSINEYKIAPSKTSFDPAAREMDLSDIEDVIYAYRRAAKIAERSGFDGIEIHGAHGYLVDEFISPWWNRRTDRYGGSFENRMRFPQEVIEAVRSEVDLPVGIRISLYEDENDGYGPDYGMKVVESLKNIDYVHVSAGNNEPPGSSASFYSPHAHIFQKIRGKAGKTLIIAGSITSGEDVDRVLSVADFAAIGRGMLADPYFSIKILTRNDGIRPCIRCNQGCRNLAYGEVRCTVNPYFVVPEPRKMYSGEIVIAGAGIKGLEASLYASKSGLKVILYEKEDRIGGQLNDIFDASKAQEFRRLIDYYGKALAKYGVDIRVGERYSGDGIYCLPDMVYPDLPDRNEIWIDSNVYMYHDLALKYASEHRVYLSSYSLSSLDRARKKAYIEIAKKYGVTIVDSSDHYDISIHEKNQYDIYRAMLSGIEAVRRYLAASENEFL